MTDIVVKRGRTRRTHSEQFKQDLVLQCCKPGMSLANVARQHGLHPNLLSRWMNERHGPGEQPVDALSPLRPQFIPVEIQPAQLVANQANHDQGPSRIEVNINRGELHIQLKLDSSQMNQLGQVLCEVLR